MAEDGGEIDATPSKTSARTSMRSHVGSAVLSASTKNPQPLLETSNRVNHGSSVHGALPQCATKPEPPPLVTRGTFRQGETSGEASPLTCAYHMLSVTGLQHPYCAEVQCTVAKYGPYGSAHAPPHGLGWPGPGSPDPIPALTSQESEDSTVL